MLTNRFIDCLEEFIPKQKRSSWSWENANPPYWTYWNVFGKDDYSAVAS